MAFSGSADWGKKTRTLNGRAAPRPDTPAYASENGFADPFAAASIADKLDLAGREGRAVTGLRAKSGGGLLLTMLLALSARVRSGGASVLRCLPGGGGAVRIMYSDTGLKRARVRSCVD